MTLINASARGRRALEALSAEENLTPRFSLGEIVITPRAMRDISHHDRVTALWMHGQGHWGHVSEDQADQNDLAIRESGVRIVSKWEEEKRSPCWIITEADRSKTTISLPEEN
ncbi:MAG: hypothetical protein EXS05_19210 [Planctomycetaceae bacterium]|nr:hypothetical protein [Planctomycetaceae bacterium]